MGSQYRSAIFFHSPEQEQQAKAKIEKGLQAVIVSYQGLDTAFGEKSVNPEEAKAEATKALAAVKKGRKELLEGAKLLH